MASGTAIRATTTIATVCPPVDARAPTGSHSAMAIEINTPTAINGSVRTATCSHDRKNVVKTGRPLSSSLVGQSIGLRLNSLSIRIPVRNTASPAITRRVNAIRWSNSMNVSISAAGFSDGAASITASDGPSRDDRSYKPEKTGPRSMSRASTVPLQARQPTVNALDRFPEHDPANVAERARGQHH